MAFEYQDQPDLFNIYQQAYSTTLANKKAKQEMQDFLSAREAMKELGGGEYLTGYEEEKAKRPNALRNLYQTGAYQQAQEIEKGIAAPFALKRAAAQAGAIEKAKRDADALIAEQLTAKIMDRFKPVGGGVGSGATTVGTGGPRGGGGRGIGMQPIIRTTKEGWPTVELDPFKAEEDARKAQESSSAQELALRNRIGTARAGAAKAQEDYKAGIITEPEMKIRIQEYGADAQSAGQELKDYLSGGAPPPPSPPTQAPSAQALPISMPTEAAPAPVAAPPAAPAAPPPVAQAPAKAPARGILTKAAEEEVRRKREAEEADVRLQQTEDRAAYRTNVFEPALKGGGPRQSLVSSKLPRMLELQNKNQYGNPFLRADLLKTGFIQSDMEAAEFEQGIKALTQSFIQPGTSGSVNTVAEMNLLSQALAGVEMTPAGNVGTMVALMNGGANDKAKLPFYTMAQKKKISFQDAATEWQNYMDSGSASAYISTTTRAKNGEVEYRGIKNPDYISAKEWMNGKRPKGQEAQAAAQPNAKVESLKEKYAAMAGEQTRQAASGYRPGAGLSSMSAPATEEELMAKYGRR